MTEIRKYVTLDEEIFKTVVDIGDVDPKLFTLEHLTVAEKRVIKGTNKTLRAALNSTRSMMQKNSKSSKKISQVELDEYGLDPSLYTEQQINFIHKKIKQFSDVYDVSSPFAYETIIEMAKNRLKTAEVEAKMIGSDNASHVRQKTDLRKDFSAMAQDLKMRPKDHKDQDKSKTRNSFTEMVRRYEARIRSGKREVNENTIAMRKKMDEIRIRNLDGKYSESSDQ